LKKGETNMIVKKKKNLSSDSGWGQKSGEHALSQKLRTEVINKMKNRKTHTQKKKKKTKIAT
jgi:hypothetical protein